jgi:ketosteroid isomerase-like protein
MAAVEDAPVEVIARVGLLLLQGDIVATLRDEDAVNRVHEILADVATPELECIMVAPDYVGPRGRLSYRGREGFVDAWREWVDAYESYSVEIEGITEGTEGRVLTPGRQRGTTRTGGVEVSQLAAAVWTVRGGKLTRVEFHLDLDAARRAAGIAD